MQEEKEDLEMSLSGTPTIRERVSYTKLSTFIQCPFKFQKLYEEKKRSKKSTLALDLGTLCHKGLEIVGEKLINGDVVLLDDILRATQEGYTDENIKGINELQSVYFEDWIAPDNKSGLSYPQKMENYKKALIEMAADDDEWQVFATEHRFEFPITEDISLYGFIDRIDKRKSDGALRLIDYKTSKKVFMDKDIKTPLQMVIYAMAIEREFGVRPIEYRYEFILIDKKQPVLSKGFVDRGIKKILRTLDEILECRKENSFKPKPSPLCHWCDYCATNAQADNQYKHECPYYSLWTPSNKTFEVNCKWEDDKRIEMAQNEFWF